MDLRAAGLFDQCPDVIRTDATARENVDAVGRTFEQRFERGCAFKSRGCLSGGQYAGDAEIDQLLKGMERVGRDIERAVKDGLPVAALTDDRGATFDINPAIVMQHAEREARHTTFEQQVRITLHHGELGCAIAKSAIARSQHGDDGHIHGLHGLLHRGQRWCQAAKRQGRVQLDAIRAVPCGDEAIRDGRCADFEEDGTLRLRHDERADRIPVMSQESTSNGGFVAGALNFIERVGNALPDPMTLFFVGAVGIIIASHVAVQADWTVQKQVKVTDEAGQTEWMEEEVRPVSLATRDGFFWAIHSMVKNFTGFAPLGIVLTGMLGIGVADKTGAIGALLKAVMAVVPNVLLTPTMVFLGIMSSAGMDAGYVVLPPIAAVMYRAAGRSPLAGIAAVFAGVSAGFCANLAITGIDPMLAGFTQAAAQLFDADYQVAATCNWTFVIASTFLLTFVGWAVSAWFVEPRFGNRPAEEGGPMATTDEPDDATGLTTAELRGLIAAGVTAAVLLLTLLALINPPFGDARLIPRDMPFQGAGASFDRWVEVIVPIILVTFLFPGMAYGIAAGTIKNDRDIAKLMGQTMADMGPYIVLAFFAGQFVAYFTHSRLGEMLAITGGEALANANMPAWLLVIVFIGIVMLANLFIGSMSAKYAILAPVFVPMFMVGAKFSPELTQAAYRIGDSCSNTITPLNPYVIIILVFMQKYVPKAGIGTLVSMMLPYSIVFAIFWTIMLIVWMTIGIPLGPEGPLWYEGAAAGAP